MREKIVQTLDHIESAYDVKILFAVESGSRAWDMASEDSDYDVRFVYMHPKDWYLSLNLERDVIEMMSADRAFDLSGWDLRKALSLTLKANPSMVQWLCSPIVYREMLDARSRFIEIITQTHIKQSLRHHHINTAKNHFKKHIVGQSEVPLKSYFYCIRPLLTIEWLKAASGRSKFKGRIPPISVLELLEDVDLDDSFKARIRNLLDLKASGEEIATVKKDPHLDDWITSILYGKFSDETASGVNPTTIEGANNLFRWFLSQDPNSRNYQLEPFTQ